MRQLVMLAVVVPLCLGVSAQAGSSIVWQSWSGNGHDYLHFWGSDGTKQSTWDDDAASSLMNGYVVERAGVPEPSAFLCLLVGASGIAGMVACGKMSRARTRIPAVEPPARIPTRGLEAALQPQIIARNPPDME